METKTTAVIEPQRADTECCPVVELRQYALHPGQREALIDLFEREFIETQEAAGMTVIGQFRDADAPDRFVWLRGFSSMAARAKALSAFYGGPVWKAHRDAANATMIDSDNVLLLRPARPGSGFLLPKHRRPARGASEIPKGLIVAMIYYLRDPDDGFVPFFERRLRPLFTGAGAWPLASLVTEESPNNFAALPVREGERVFAWFASFPDEAAYQRYHAAVVADRDWSGRLASALRDRIRREPEELRITPTARSLLHA